MISRTVVSFSRRMRNATLGRPRRTTSAGNRAAARLTSSGRGCEVTREGQGRATMKQSLMDPLAAASTAATIAGGGLGAPRTMNCEAAADLIGRSP